MLAYQWFADTYLSIKLSYKNITETYAKIAYLKALCIND